MCAIPTVWDAPYIHCCSFTFSAFFLKDSPIKELPFLTHGLTNPNKEEKYKN